MPWDALSEEQRELRDLVRTLARERIAPRAAEIDASHEFPWDIVEFFRENDIFGLFFAEDYSGLGTGTLLSLIAIEEVSKVCATSGLILAVQELGSLGLKLAGSDEQKQQWLPRLATGEWLCAYALTESGSGSDSAAMRTTARVDNGEYVLNGSLRRGSGSPRARPTTRSNTRRPARRWAVRSRSTSSWLRCSPTWRRSAKRRAACSTSSGKRSTRESMGRS